MLRDLGWGWGGDTFSLGPWMGSQRSPVGHTHNRPGVERLIFLELGIHSSSDSQGGSELEEEREGVNNTVAWGGAGGMSLGGTGGVWGGSPKEVPPVLHLKEWGAGEGQQREQGAPRGAEAWEGPHGPPHPQQKSSP